MPESCWSRRDFFRTVGLAGAAIGGIGGHGGRRTPAAVPEATAPEGKVRRYVSRPDLKPPAVRVTGRAAQPVFVTPKGYAAQAAPAEHGLMILDPAGEPLWFRATASTPMNLRPQTYRGRPVLTWWEGDVPDGYGQGRGYVMDASYRTIATLRTGGGVHADLHELRLTDRGTALLTAYRTARTDLTAVGGPRDGLVYAGVVQEVDVATGAVLFGWDSLDHVDVTESYQVRGVGRGVDQPYDYFHINGIDVHPDGDLLVSARNTWTVYKVSRTDGRVRWRLGGRRSDFTHGPGTRFYWQHHVTAHGSGRISLFDNGSSPAMEHASRGLVLDVGGGTVSLARAYRHPAGVLADNQGSCQLLAEGGALLDWGNRPGFSAFAADGRLVMDGRFPDGMQSYRAFTADWTGRPTDRPSLTAQNGHLYATWNGSTEVTHWRPLTGKRRDRLKPEAAAVREGFETAIDVRTRGPYFAIEALDRHGHPLARSTTIRAT